jgi:hypothetical protein
MIGKIEQYISYLLIFVNFLIFYYLLSMLVFPRLSLCIAINIKKNQLAGPQWFMPVILAA